MHLQHSQGKSSGMSCFDKRHRSKFCKIMAIINMQDPVSVKDVQKLIGRVATLNRFIPRVVERSFPFFNVLRNSKNSQWCESQKQAFQELKDYLSNMNKLCPPEPKFATSIVLVCFKFDSKRCASAREKRRRKAKTNSCIFCFRSSFRL
jgi:hypothetical protein